MYFEPEGGVWTDLPPVLGVLLLIDHAMRGLVSFVPPMVAIVERVSAHSSCLRGFFLLAFESTSRGLPVKRFAFKWARAFTA